MNVLSSAAAKLRHLMPRPAKNYIRSKVLGRSFDEVFLVYWYGASLFRSRLMIDVGAHFGGALKNFACDGWQVHAFEPDSRNRARLEREWGGRANVRINAAAVSDRTETRTALYRSAVSSGISGLLDFHESHVLAEYVPTVTLADYLEAAQIAAVGLLKVDTEGYDLPVLRGLDWRRAAPEVVICEFEDRKTQKLGYGFEDLAGFLSARNYQVLTSEWYPVERYGGPHRWRRLTRFPGGLASAEAWGNLIAIRDSDFFRRFSERIGRWLGD
jgi:FkbM family methyltransferase